MADNFEQRHKSRLFILQTKWVFEKMKIISKIVSLLMTAVIVVGVLTSCSKNSLRPHDALPAIKPLFMHVGYMNNTTLSKYMEYTDEDLQVLKDIGVTEVCIAFGSYPASYIPEGETEPRPLVTDEDIDGITAEMVGASSQTDLDSLKALYKQNLGGLDDGLTLNKYAEFAVELLRRLVAVNPDIEIWYAFPDIRIATLAELYIEPFLQYYEKLKSDTGTEIWEKNVKGMYWIKEGVSTKTYELFNTNNLEDFDNATVKAMKACCDVVHGDGKLTFWCPYYRPTVEIGLPIGFIANQTDIFDYVILQPNHFFADGLENNIEIIKQSTLQNTVLNAQSIAYGGEKKSSTMIGPEFEMDSKDFDGSRGAHNIEKYQDYVAAYGDMIGKYPVAIYCGERRSLMDDRSISFLKDLLNNNG